MKKENPYIRFLRIAQGEEHLARESAEVFERFSKEKDDTGAFVIFVFAIFLFLLVLL